MKENYSFLFKQLSFTSLFIFTFGLLHSQEYQWEWALHGGTNRGEHTGYYPEKIYDIKVGSDNNYYILASFEGDTDAHLNNVPQSTRNNFLGNNDIFLFSTTCEGEVRWTQTIGGGSSDSAYQLVLDSENNVYIAATLEPWIGTTNDMQYRVHFSDEEYVLTPYDLPDYDPQWPIDSSFPMEFYKNTFLIKYDSEGNYITRKTIESDPISGDTFSLSAQSYRSPSIFHLMIDANDHLHFMGIFGKGNYMDNEIHVPDEYYYNSFTGESKSQFRMIQCDTNFNYISDILLPVPDSTSFTYADKSKFIYDSQLQRYYILGSREYGINADSPTFIYDEKEVQNMSFLIAINATNGNEIWRREIGSYPSSTLLSHIEMSSIAIDNNSDVYIAGKVYVFSDDPAFKIYDPHQPSTTTHWEYPTAYTYLPTLIKFDSSGSVQWVKYPTDFATNFTTGTHIEVHGIAINGDEVAIGSSEGYFEWDSFTQNYPPFHGLSPTVLRFNKYTGQTIGMHFIKAGANIRNYASDIAVDNDGNYILGGSFTEAMGDILHDINPMTSAGEYDFFIAKLSNSPCGSGLSIEDFSQANYRVYPNPTDQWILVDTTDKLSHYKLFNILGQQVKSESWNDILSYQIDMRDLEAGEYILQLFTTEGKSSTAKVIKK